jgi:hypothetical protein
VTGEWRQYQNTSLVAAAAGEGGREGVAHVVGPASAVGKNS